MNAPPVRRGAGLVGICPICRGYLPVYANGHNPYDGTFTCVYCNTRLKDTYWKRLKHSDVCRIRRRVMALNPQCSCYAATE